MSNSKDLSRLLTSDDRGAVLILVSLMLPVLVGLAILVVDAGRLYNMETSLQNNVDAVALAGAAELDRRPDAHIRACLAMSTLVSNKTLFSNGDALLEAKCAANGEPATDSDVEWKWLRTIPADYCSLTAPGTGDCYFEFSSDPATTFYIAVKSRRTADDFTMLFPATLISSSNPPAINRTAVAGLSIVACKPTPLMLCNPWESSGLRTIPALRDPVNGAIGSLTTLREYGGGGADIGPGEFGLVNPGNTYHSCDGSTLSASVVQTLTLQIAGAELPNCNVRNGVCPKTGVVAKLDDALNTRFDMYEGSMKGNFLLQNESILFPAYRTIWYDGDAEVSGCTRKPAVNGETWYPAGNGKIWYPETYFSNAGYGVSGSITLPDGTVKAIANLTRYEAYLWEVEKAVTQTSPPPPYYAKANEDTCFVEELDQAGLSRLNSMSVPGSSEFKRRRDRRDIYASIVNCGEIKDAIDAGAPYSLNGASTSVPLPILAIAKFFITEPVNRTIQEAPKDAVISEGSQNSNSPTAWPVPPYCEDKASDPDWKTVVFKFTTLEANKTYYIYRPLGGPLSANTPDNPTVQDLVDGFTSSAAPLLGTDKEYYFCSKPGSNFLFVATKQEHVVNASDLQAGFTHLDGNKKFNVELVDVYGSGNGGNSVSNIVKLYR